MQSVSTFFKVEKDMFYKLGAEKTRHVIVENLLTNHIANSDKEYRTLMTAPNALLIMAWSRSH